MVANHHKPNRSLRPRPSARTAKVMVTLLERRQIVLTTGTFAKLYSGGGELVAHSSVHASHGSLPAFRPLRSERMMLKTKTSNAAVWKTAPIVQMVLSPDQPRSAP